MRESTTMTKPYLSIVATSRNDNHGGNLNLRMQVFVNALLAQAERHKLPTELVLVDWNPPSDKPMLAQALTLPARHPYCTVRTIVVPPIIHEKYVHAARLPLYQMIGKNVGIRRSRGEFVLCTNVDVVFSDPLFTFLAQRSLEYATSYRTDRYDTGNEIKIDWPLPHILAYCANNLIRLNLRDASLNLKTNQRHKIYPQNSPKRHEAPPHLHTNACGDFTLLSRSDWLRLRGYAEWDIYSFHLDSLFLYTAHYGGCREVVLPPDHVHYHIEHCEGWTPEIHGAGILERHLEQNKIARLDNATLASLIQDMAMRKKPLMVNPEHWGLADSPLPDTCATMAAWEHEAVSATTASEPISDKPYLSLVVTTRNDDHGGNMARRFQIFLDHLDDMAQRHHVPMELIVVEWNPDSERPPLANAMQWPTSPWLHTRIVTVPPEIHAMHDNHDKMPLFQMIAKNVGIRRACGEFVLATNVDLVFSDELFAFLARRDLEHACLYRIDRHDIGATTIPEGISWQERIDFCERNIIRVHAQHGTYAWGDKRPEGDPQKLHTNACGDFTLLSRDKWLQLKGYPEFHLWSIFIDGLFLHAAAVCGIQQVVLDSPCRIYHIEHDIGWAKTQEPISVRPSLNYRQQYLPLCAGMLARRRPLDVNSETWGLSAMALQETIPSSPARVEKKTTPADAATPTPFAYWLKAIAAIQHRLYYRDQSVASLQSLANMVHRYNPTVIIELGTLSGLSLRAWLLASQTARVHAVDLSFKSLRESSDIFPVDLSRVTLHEQDILTLDFPSLWNENDRVLLFVDAHDLPSVPIMEHVLRTALPFLPRGSLVAVDDLWHSPDRLVQSSARGYFDAKQITAIDELQCFNGYFAPYHAGGTFMGFLEVIPLLEFVNTRGISLNFEPGGKHVWFAWDGDMHAATRPQNSAQRHDAEWGVVEYNPLRIDSPHPLVRRVLGTAEQLYQKGKIGDAAVLLSDFVKKEPRPEACLALAVCFARLGRLTEAYGLVSTAERLGVPSARIKRLRRDLSQRLGVDGLRKTGKRGVTLFAIPKPFTGHAATIQKNAIRSWARLTPRPEIILFGDEPGIGEMACEIGARHVAEVARNEFGTPLVSDIFHSAAKLAENDILAYVNADIILFDDFMAGAANAAAFHDEFLLVGRRWDVCVTEEIDFNDCDWRAILREAITSDGFLHRETGLDYFVHTKGLWPDMPPFALGRCAWDNWLMKRPITMGKTVIDASAYITAVHQDHGYTHAGGWANVFGSGIETERNRAMAGSVLGCTTDTRFHLTAKGKVEPRVPLSSNRGSPEANAARVQWLIVQAEKMMQKGLSELAEVKCEEAAQLQPENARIRELLLAARASHGETP